MKHYHSLMQQFLIIPPPGSLNRSAVPFLYATVLARAYSWVLGTRGHYHFYMQQLSICYSFFGAYHHTLYAYLTWKRGSNAGALLHCS